MHTTDTSSPRPASRGPSLRVWAPAGDRATAAVVLVLHGGRSDSTAPARSLQPAYLRMHSLARSVHGAVRADGAAVWLLRNRVRGWNGTAEDPVRDAEWALEEIQRRHPGACVVLLGHSMGGRVALRLTGHRRVRSVCALAPWTEPGDPVGQLTNRGVLLVHGDRDRIVPARGSVAYVPRARQVGTDVSLVEIANAGHAMLRHRREWTAVTLDFVTDAVRSITDRSEP